MVSLAVVILTYNEALHIRRAISSVQSIASEIFVIDSGSTDGTVEIAQELGAVVLSHPFASHAKQFQWALDCAPITADWILRLDADEVVEADLSREIAVKIPTLPTDVAGINLKRKHIFMGRWIRFGGRYPLLLLRIWRRGQGKVEDRWMDEHVVVSGGRTITFSGRFADHNLNNLSFFTEKHNGYATREAVEVLIARYELLDKARALPMCGTSWQAASKRWLKVNIYGRLPFALSACFYFLWRYLFQLGFLDGRPGLVYHFLQGFWYRFLVGAKVSELEGSIAQDGSKNDALFELSRLTGLQLVQKL